MASQRSINEARKAAKPKVNPLSMFQKIHKRTSVYTPTKPIPGELIIICTWLGAAPKHIAKYVEMYGRVAPGARILLIESSVPILVSSYAHQRRMIQPSVGVVLDTLAESSFECPQSGSSSNEKLFSTASISTLGERPPPRILLHTFSNGGCNTATQLLLMLSDRTGTALPLTGILLDSCPAKGTYQKSYDAMVLSLPKDTATRLLGAIIVHGLLLLLYTWIACGNENPASLMRRTLLSDKTVRESWEANLSPNAIFSADDKQDTVANELAITDERKSLKFSGRACYIYSKADKMCLWTDIKEHADDARSMGWDVKELVFEDTGHVAHYQKNEAAYTDVARQMWEPEGYEQRQRRLKSRL